MDKQNGKKAYINIRLKLASEKLRMAKILIKNGGYRDAISRAYYCVFYAAKAFLLKQGQDDPSSHKGLDVTFHHFCATHPEPPPELAKIFSLMRKARLDAEYHEEAQLTQQDAQEAIDMAVLFLKEIEAVLKHKTSR